MIILIIIKALRSTNLDKLTSNTTTILSSSFTRIAIYDFICQKLIPSLIMTSSIFSLFINLDTVDPPQYTVCTCIPTSRIANILSVYPLVQCIIPFVSIQETRTLSDRFPLYEYPNNHKS